MAKSSLFNTRRSLALLFVSLFVASLAVLSRPFKHSPPLTAANGLNARSVLNLTENHGLHKRVTYAASIEKGRALNCKMSASIAHGIQLNGGTPLESAIEEEIFVSEPEFGWSMMDGKKPKYESTGLTNTDSTINADILKQLTGASPAGTVYNYIFNDNSVLLENGQEAHPTEAYYGTGINGAGGVIIADSNRSPRHTPDYIPGQPLSQITQWSQAAFGQWMFQVSAEDGDIKGLRFIIQSWVINPDTQEQVVSALRAVGETQVPNFATRRVFSRTSDNEAEVNGFYAILGTPNGVGGGFLLATHKARLGVKRFASVTVWNYPGAFSFGLGEDAKLMLSFEIETVAQPTTGNS